VLGVTAGGPSLEAVLQKAYVAAGKIHFDGMHYRKDIGRHNQKTKTAGD
jgi:phosphoribosylamine---glycine ligase